VKGRAPRVSCVTVLASLAVFVALPAVASDSEALAAGATPFEAPFLLQARGLRGLRAEVVAEILGKQEGGELSLAVLAAPLPVVDGKARVPVFIEIDGASFLRHNQSEMTRV